MIVAGSGLKVVVATRPVDFRKGHDGLVAVVEHELGLDPYSGIVFVFRPKRADRINAPPLRALFAGQQAAVETLRAENAALTERNSPARGLRRRSGPRIDRVALMALAQDLPAVWNAPTTTMGAKQRLLRVLVEEVLLDLDDDVNQTVVTIHWMGGRHSETRVARVRTRRSPSKRQPKPVDVMRKLGGRCPDRELAVTMSLRAGGLRDALQLSDDELQRAGFDTARLRAAVELGTRYTSAAVERGETLTSPATTKSALLTRLRNRPHEIFACLFLDNRHRILVFEEMIRGTIDDASVHPREVRDCHLTGSIHISVGFRPLQS